MKTILETPDIINRGVILIAETEEERLILGTLWERKGKVVACRLKYSELTVGPTEDEETRP